MVAPEKAGRTPGRMSRARKHEPIRKTERDEKPDTPAPIVAARASERALAVREVAFGLAHDANNILAALRLRVGLLIKDRTCQAAQGRNLAAIDRILGEAAALLSRLQRLGDTHETDELGAVDLRDAIASAIEIAHDGLPPHRRSAVYFRCDLGPMPRVRGNKAEIRDVLVNLFINARDAMPYGGLITVRGKHAGDSVVLRVEDEGPGIPPEVLPKIFDAFFTTKGTRGTGLGLAMARRVMKRSGGAITASNRPQGGACFELRFVPHHDGPRRPARRLTPARWA